MSPVGRVSREDPSRAPPPVPRPVVPVAARPAAISCCPASASRPGHCRQVRILLGAGRTHADAYGSDGHGRSRQRAHGAEMRRPAMRTGRPTSVGSTGQAIRSRSLRGPERRPPEEEVARARSTGGCGAPRER
jgi:hypothetical protein